MEKKTSNDLANYRLERAKLDLADAELLFQENSLLSANNRAYYAIFHAINAVHALDGKSIDPAFKRLKSTSQAG